LKFVRDMPDKEQIDTIVIGSSIGLNNVNGPVLEKTSKKIQHVLNFSAFSMEVSHILPLIRLFSLFPNLKRVIYSTQTLDFTGVTPYKPTNIDLLKEYIQLGATHTNLKYTLLVYKNIINSIKRRLIWEKTYMAHNKFTNLDFDYTGSAGLHIYGKDIIQSRWNKSYIVKTNKESYKALDTMIKQLKKENIKFYLVAQPYRSELVRKYKKIRTILANFHYKTKKVLLENHGYFLNLHEKLHLEDQYFADRIHLNDTGNVIVSKQIAIAVDSNE